MRSSWLGVGATRRALDEKHSYWVLKKLQKRGLVRHVAWDRYELTAEGLSTATELDEVDR